PTLAPAGLAPRQGHVPAHAAAVPRRRRASARRRVPRPAEAGRRYRRLLLAGHLGHALAHRLDRRGHRLRGLREDLRLDLELGHRRHVLLRLLLLVAVVGALHGLLRIDHLAGAGGEDLAQPSGQRLEPGAALAGLELGRVDFAVLDAGGEHVEDVVLRHGRVLWGWSCGFWI